MVKKKVYALLFFIISTMASHVVAMDTKHLAFFIENPFDKKQEDDVQLTLDSSVVQENDFFAEKAKEPDSISVKGQNDLASVSHSRVIHSPKKQLFKLRKKTKKRYVDVFEKNDDDEFICPYNCPENYTIKRGQALVSHIQRRHDKNFNLQTFDHEKNDLNAYISRKGKDIRRGKKYAEIFEKNEGGQYMCPYNCRDDYANKKGNNVVKHITRRHNPDFELQTFERQKEDLEAWISRGNNGLIRYADVFKKNDNNEFECPYNCRDNYTHKKGQPVSTHIKARHDPNFDLKTFDSKKSDLDAWIPPRKTELKRNSSIRSGELLRMHGKRKRENHDKKGRLKKKRKLKI